MYYRPSNIVQLVEQMMDDFKSNQIDAYKQIIHSSSLINLVVHTIECELMLGMLRILKDKSTEELN